MTLIYAIQANQKQAEKIAKAEHLSRIETPHGFKRVDYNATKVVIIGDHPKVEKAYRGIMLVEVVDPESDTKDPKPESED